MKNKNNKNLLIKKRLWSFLETFSFQNLFFYVNTNDEVLTKYFFHLFKNKKLFIPFVKGEKIYFSQVKDLSNLETASFGILEPKEKIRTKENPDIIIIPGVVFDEKGNRIGFGKGYYDKFLSKHPKSVKIALAFDFQVFTSIPFDEHDISVDIIITEKRVIKCK